MIPIKRMTWSCRRKSTVRAQPERGGAEEAGDDDQTEEKVVAGGGGGEGVGKERDLLFFKRDRTEDMVDGSRHLIAIKWMVRASRPSWTIGPCEEGGTGGG